ncbi:hypothetical protein [Micromonospora sp. NPDC047730]|uniref:hypothetical protein n=1 Tax=Micromonospora sp. NPDC047730 TaxID=3364253 RepID=UPI00371A9734
MIRNEAERLQRALDELVGATGVEGIRAATRLRDDMQKSIQRSRALMAADLYYLKGMSSREIASAVSEGGTPYTQAGVFKWLKAQIGQDPLVYVGVWRDGDDFHMDTFPAESPDQIRKVVDGGVRLAPATWELDPSTADAKDVWRRLTRLES